MVTFSGCYTALITPMNRNRQVDYEGLQQLVDFQIKNGVKGILAVGTTGESPTLDWNEHSKVIEKVHEFSKQFNPRSHRRNSTCPRYRSKLRATC
jgi:4-hydroxy-tetrahydrodipicolinate synthase